MPGQKEGTKGGNRTAKKPNKQFETQKEQKGTHLSNYNLVGEGHGKDFSEINLEGQEKVFPLCAHGQQ